MRSIALCALLAVATPAAAQTEQSEVPASQRDLLRDGLAVFRSDQGGPVPTPHYSAYRITYLLEQGKQPLYFTYEHDQFVQTYRVMYIAEPTFAFRRDGPILFPIPPFQGDFRSTVHVMGVALGLPQGSATPTHTSWLPLAVVKLRTTP